MKYYFGSQERTKVLDTSGMFTAKGVDDHLFYYGIEFGSNNGGTEEFVIFDGCDRRIPIDIGSIGELIYTLTLIQDQCDTMREADKIREKLEDCTAERVTIHDHEEDYDW